MPPGFAANVGAANDPAANRIVVAVIIQREISMAPSSLMFAVSDDGDGSEPTARAVIVFACPTNLRWPLAQSKRCTARTPAVHIRPGPPRIISGLRLCIRVCRTGPLPKRILLPACRPEPPTNPPSAVIGPPSPGSPLAWFLHGTPRTVPSRQLHCGDKQEAGDVTKMLRDEPCGDRTD